MTLELLLPFKPVPLERARSDRGVTHDTERNRAVKRHVGMLWRAAHPGRQPIPAGVPIMLTVDSRFGRPASHYIGKRKDGVLRADAPRRWHAQKPDGDNLVKLLADSLTRIAWDDDAQIAYVHAQKTWTRQAGHTLLSVHVLS